jgi:hypothetical protein
MNNRYNKTKPLTQQQIDDLRKRLADAREEDQKRAKVRCAKCKHPTPCKCR